MTVPPPTDQRWQRIVAGTYDPPITTLATKLAIARLRQSVRDHSVSLGQAVAELHRFFTDNTFAHRDLGVI